jgi:hypothetical protein
VVFLEYSIHISRSKFSAPCAPIECMGQATVDALGAGTTRLVIHGLDFLVELAHDVQYAGFYSVYRFPIE